MLVSGQSLIIMKYPINIKLAESEGSLSKTRIELCWSRALLRLVDLFLNWVYLQVWASLTCIRLKEGQLRLPDSHRVLMDRSLVETKLGRTL